MRIGANQSVRISLLDSINDLRKDDARQVFQVDLVDNSHIGRNYGEIVERCLSPAEKGIALTVAFELKKRIRMESVGSSEFVHLHRVVNHQFSRLQGIDRVWIAPKPLHCIAHRSQINNCRHAGKILHQHAGRSEGDFSRRRSRRLPLREKANVILRD